MARSAADRPVPACAATCSRKAGASVTRTSGPRGSNGAKVRGSSETTVKRLSWGRRGDPRRELRRQQRRQLTSLPAVDSFTPTSGGRLDGELGVALGTAYVLADSFDERLVVHAQTSRLDRCASGRDGQAATRLGEASDYTNRVL